MCVIARERTVENDVDFNHPFTQLLSVLRAAWRYGTSLYYQSAYVNQLLSNFMHIYDLQEKGELMR